MPSRRAVLLIVAFWVAVTGYVAYRDLWPILFASGPPPVAIDLADEAAQNIPIRWTVSWNGKPVGKLTTQMRYVDADDTFKFTNTYRQLRVEVGVATMVVPEFTTVVRVTRGGDLREQSAEGNVELELRGVKLGSVTAKLDGRVADGRLAARFDGSYQLAGMTRQSLSKTLEPVDVPKGQPLNPMMPVNRLNGVGPGRPRWVVHESDPFKDAFAAVVAEFGVPLPDAKKGPLFGEVLSDTQELAWHEQSVTCRVIEYRREEVLEVRTWVRESDGKVLKQEAFKQGDTLSVERDK